MSLRSIPLRSKLVAALVLPMVIVVALIGVRIDRSLDERAVATRQADEAERLRAVARFADAIGAEAVAVSDETTTVAGLAAARAQTDAAVDALRDPGLGLDTAASRLARTAYAELTGLRATLGGDPSAVRDAYDLETWQADAPNVEGADPSAEPGTVSFALARLYALPLEVFDVVEFAPDAIADPATARSLVDHELARRVRSDRIVELATLLRLASTPTLIVDDDVLATVSVALATTDADLAVAEQVGTPALVGALEAVEASTTAGEYRALRDAAATTAAGENPLLGSVALNEAGTDVVEQLDAVTDAVLDDVVAQSEAGVFAATRDLVVWALVGLWVVVVAALILRVLYRAIKAPLERLTERSQEIATLELPEVVAAMRRGEIDGVPELTEIPVESRDEIGELVEAFNDVHRTAIRLAAEQAGSRRVVADMFVNLGRRNQKLVNRLLRRLSAIEQDEHDPDKLAALYEIDHVATRMRRNAESLLVLAGAGQSRSWDHPVDVYDIARAALSEVEGYERVRIDVSEMEIHGDLVADLTHLLAELVENALSFSPPTTEVELVARAVDGGHVIVVSDHGLGMSDGQLADANRRIEDAADQAETPSEFLGHYVIGRLAARHGIRVELASSASGGVSARVSLPAGAIVPTASQLVEEFDLAPRSAPAAPAPAEAPVDLTASAPARTDPAVSATSARGADEVPPPAATFGEQPVRARLDPAGSEFPGMVGPDSSVPAPPRPVPVPPIVPLPPVAPLPAADPGGPTGPIPSRPSAAVDATPPPSSPGPSPSADHAWHAGAPAPAPTPTPEATATATETAHLDRSNERGTPLDAAPPVVGAPAHEAPPVRPPEPAPPVSAPPAHEVPQVVAHEVVTPEAAAPEPPSHQVARPEVVTHEVEVPQVEVVSPETTPPWLVTPQVEAPEGVASEVPPPRPAPIDLEPSLPTLPWSASSGHAVEAPVERSPEPPIEIEPASVDRPAGVSHAAAVAAPAVEPATAPALAEVVDPFDPGSLDAARASAQSSVDQALSVFATTRTPGANLPDTSFISSLSGSMRLDLGDDDPVASPPPFGDLGTGASSGPFAGLASGGDADRVRFQLSGFQQGTDRADREDRP